MRTLSKKTQYSLRALYALARAYGSSPILIAGMSRQERIPKKFLEQILLKLKAHGLVQSRMGKGGGYLLAQAPEAVTIGHVIRIMEGPLAPLPCAALDACCTCPECADARYCETCLVMQDVRKAIVAVLDSTTLADACRRADHARAGSQALDELLLQT